MQGWVFHSLFLLQTCSREVEVSKLQDIGAWLSQPTTW